MSDLHLESVGYPEGFDPDPPPFDVLVCAGDVFEGDVARSAKTLKRLASGKPVIYVLGNHEFWGRRLGRTNEAAAKACAGCGVTLLDRASKVVEGIRFVGATLWTDYRLNVVPKVYVRADGTQVFSNTLAHPSSSLTEPIRDERGKKATVADVLALHLSDVAFLEEATSRDSDLPTVVVTHHAPVPESVHEKFAARNVASLSASDLGTLVDSCGAEAWIHGHVHHNVDDVRTSGIRVVCNPGGNRMLNHAFSTRMVIDIPRAPTFGRSRDWAQRSGP